MKLEVKKVLRQYRTDKARFLKAELCRCHEVLHGRRPLPPHGDLSKVVKVTRQTLDVPNM